MKKVSLSWIDSIVGPEGWQFIEDIKERRPSKVCTTGFLFAETDDYITIAHSYTKTQVQGRLMIPKCSIVSGYGKLKEANR